MRSESLKLAQKKYHEKIKNDPIFIHKRKLSQQRYRQKNYERCLEINRNSNRNRYNQIDNIKEKRYRRNFSERYSSILFKWFTT